MPLSNNGAARPLHEDRESRLLSAVQRAAFERLQQEQTSEWLHSTFGMNQIERWASTLQVPERQQSRPLLRGRLEGFVKTCQRWRLEKDQEAVLLGCPDTASADELLSGRSLSLSQDVTDRIGYVVGISIGLGTVFDESVAAELDWLNRPHPKLHNKSPRDHILQGRMVQLIAVAALVDEERALR
jgi:hypothetical protein